MWCVCFCLSALKIKAICIHLFISLNIICRVITSLHCYKTPSEFQCLLVIYGALHYLLFLLRGLLWLFAVCLFWAGTLMCLMFFSEGLYEETRGERSSWWYERKRQDCLRKHSPNLRLAQGVSSHETKKCLSPKTKMSEIRLTLYCFCFLKFLCGWTGEMSWRSWEAAWAVQ